MKAKRFNLIFLQILLLCSGSCLLSSCQNEKAGSLGGEKSYPAELTLSKSELLDKVKGGWLGQVIGCTYGRPTEMEYRGTIIQEYVPIVWDDTRLLWHYENDINIFDDIYVELSFVEVIENEGTDAPASSHARALAHAEYPLWHANQAARYNILQGMEPPATGHWENNPHADDIDFQIEADFAGLMNPGMVNSASALCDRVGHIMNYGDGWYGGVYMAAMYALAFYSDDISFIVSEGLKAIPEQSDFYKCIRDVIGWCGEYPKDWKQTWFETEKKWSFDVGCPGGVFRPFNIDAKLNAAYIVIGLLYGNGDFGKTVDITTRCGQDSDCNPASSGGILGTMLGYDQIPEYWKQGLDQVEDMDFMYTTLSLNEVYDMSYRHALAMILANGGEVGEDEVIIPLEQAEPVKLEQGFEGHVPVSISPLKLWKGYPLEYGGETEHNLVFKGIGFVMRGGAGKLPGTTEDKELLVDVYIDGVLYEEAVLPTSYNARRNELTWKYNLPEGEHHVRVVWKNPTEGYKIHIYKEVIYGPVPPFEANTKGRH